MNYLFDAKVSHTAMQIKATADSHGCPLSEAKKFYTYIFLDPRKHGHYEYMIEDKKFLFSFEPFYVGKGTARRITQHETAAKRGANTYMSKKLRSIASEGVDAIKMKLFENDTDAVALAKEMLLIKAIGRSDLDAGPLVNLTNGGEGCSGYVLSEERKQVHRRFRHTQETIDRISAAHKGKKLTDAHRAKLSAAKIGKTSHNKGKKLTPEQRQKLSESLRGRVMSNEAREKIGNAHRGMKRSAQTAANISAALKAKPVQTCEHCGFTGSGGFTRWHGSNCRSNPNKEVSNGL